MGKGLYWHCLLYNPFVYYWNNILNDIVELDIQHRTELHGGRRGRDRW
jgi:hypothetical protein